MRLTIRLLFTNFLDWINNVFVRLPSFPACFPQLVNHRKKLANIKKETSFYRLP
jgi:hypothetical protein